MTRNASVVSAGRTVSELASGSHRSTSVTATTTLLNWDSNGVPVPSDWSVPAAEAIERVTSRWVLAGALAALRYRLAVRETTDVDILVSWHPELTATLEKAGYPLRTYADPGEHPHLLVSRGDRGAVDFIVATTDYQELAIDRGMVDHALTVEDVLIHKLLAWRPRDRDDIVSILAARHEFDNAFVELWAREWDVFDRWLEISRR